MNKKNALNALWITSIVLLVALSINSIAAQNASSSASSSAYPPPATSTPPAYPPPSVSPTPITLPPPKSSQAAQKALDYIVKRDGIPVEALTILDDRLIEYPSLRRKLQVVTLLDTRPEGQVYKLLVDLASGRIDDDRSTSLDAEEAQAYQAKYGKLQPALYERLRMLTDKDALPVAIWIASPPGKTLADLQEAALAAVATKYPAAQAAMARSGKPMDVDDPELARRIEAEYIALLKSEIKALVQPLVTDLRRRNFAVAVHEGLPSLTAILPKSIILEMGKRADVSAIYLIEETPQPELDSAVPNTLAPIVWGRGYTGSGVTIAILEQGNVDPNNSFLNLAASSRASNLGVQDHTTRVASDAASFHNTYTGVAKGATILSAGHNGTEADLVAGLQWALDQGARIVNLSEGYQADNLLNWSDRAFDYWARQRFRLLTKSAGNTGGSLTSPGKGWNVLTVGAYSDNNNTNWSDDQIWIDSAYINPVSARNDREKPEVVAVGVSITAVGVNNVPVTRDGTSHAAPQVAGLGALLISRNSALNSWPEAMRAIMMASATHNIEGTSIIVRGQGDLKDGAGAINADLADKAAQVRGISTSACNASCWWGDSIPNSSFPVGTEITRTFNATTTTLVRVAIAWWANADTPANNYSFSRLDTDLDLRIKGPSGQYISSASSTSYDNNYEIVEFVAQQAGQYQIAIRKFRADESSNYLGTALVMIPLLRKAYLPLIMKNP